MNVLLMCQNIMFIISIIVFILSSIVKCFMKIEEHKLIVLLIRKGTFCLFLFLMTLTMYKDSFNIFYLGLYIVCYYNMIQTYDLYYIYKTERLEKLNNNEE